MATQQTQTLEYFDSHANDWMNKALGSGDKEVNIIKQRNDYVLHIIDTVSDVRSFVDLGCGAGQLVCDVSKRNIDSTGVDFSQKMIDLAIKNASKHGLNNAQFHCCSIFDFSFKESAYDVISGNGLIEYISFDELKKLLELSYSALRNNGKLVLGSRNRLFNMISMNQFTLCEVENQKANHMLYEAIDLIAAKSLDEFSDKSVNLTYDEYAMPNTGIDVEIRKQYTPRQLIRLLKEVGFGIHDLYPIHIHGVTPAFKSSYPIEHTKISNYLQTFAQGNYSLIPQSSSFMICVTKK